jgi:hypothetical protein
VPSHTLTLGGAIFLTLVGAIPLTLVGASFLTQVGVNVGLQRAKRDENQRQRGRTFDPAACA